MSGVSIALLSVFWICASYAQEISLTTASGTHAPTGDIRAGELIFEDNFDTLDMVKWQHENTLGGGGNWEFQWYTNNRSNSYVENSILHIKPTLVSDEYGNDFLYSGTLDVNGGSPSEACTNPQWYGCSRTGSATNVLNPIKSARLRTVNSFSFKYGKVEVRAKNPSGDWLWPAIWMLPRYNAYSTWPSSGEIDIMESRGNQQLTLNNVNIGTQLVGSTLHWGPNGYNNRYEMTHFEKNNGAGYNSDYHNYQVEWAPTGFTFSIDDEVIGTVAAPDGGFWNYGGFGNSGMENPWRSGTSMAPFDDEFYIVINLAVGGVAFFPDAANNSPGGKPWANTSPKASTDFWEGREQWLSTWNMGSEDSHLKIDYVRVWAI